MANFTEISTKELLNEIKNQNAKIIDIRSSEAYNGWKVIEAFFNAWLMGWPKIAVFDGGWFEWSNNNLPFETGLPK